MSVCQLRASSNWKASNVTDMAKLYCPLIDWVRMRSSRLSAIFIAPLLLTGVAAQEGQRPSSSTELKPPTANEQLPRSQDTPVDVSDFWTSGRYRLTPSDVIELRFPYVPEFDQTVTVQPDGYVSLRVVGDIRVAGRTLPQFKEMLNEAYVDVLREPVINVILKEFEKPYFTATGEVAKPGKYELRGSTTLTQGLTLAGGHTRDAKHSQVIIFRRFSNEWVEVKQLDVKKMYDSHNLSEDPLLRPGDTVFVPRNVLSHIAPFIPRPSLGIYFNPFP
jgi:polysaccharide export outer membrane protein